MRKLGLPGNILASACSFLWPSANPGAPLLILKLVAPWRSKGLIGVALAVSILQPASALAGGGVQASIPFRSLNYEQPIGNIAPTSVGDSYNQSIYIGDTSSNYNFPSPIAGHCRPACNLPLPMVLRPLASCCRMLLALRSAVVRQPRPI